ncbi:hypothetical protein, partial [Aequorivita sp. CIP111184]|uniref:hypothetical protein n=1 Tax=Aequorivita sp. CIP111184 TaxID=2211356 RepID=UPI0011BEBBE7
MIAITDTSGYSGVEFLEENSPSILPKEAEIQLLIGASEFVNSSITSAFKDLLIQIINETQDQTGTIFFQPAEVVQNISAMFLSIGFKYNGSILTFSIADDALNIGTTRIIDKLHTYNNFKDIARNAFVSVDNDWALKANNIRAFADTGLRKLHYITVQYIRDNTSILFNTRKEHSRISTIMLNTTADDTMDEYRSPIMPAITVYNNSNVPVRLRLKVVYENFSTRTDSQYGPQESFDINENGTLETIGLNRKDQEYFPEEGEILSTPYEDDHTIAIDPLQSREIDFGVKIRGGKGILEFVPGPIQNIPMNENEIHGFNFYIQGENPSYDDVIWYLNRDRIEGGQTISYLERFWFFIRLIREESGSGEGTGDDYPFLNFQETENNLNTSYGVKWINENGTTQLRATGFPTFGFPKGLGMVQIDNYGSIDNLGDILNIAPNFQSTPLGNTIIANNGKILLKTQSAEAFIVASSEDIWNWKKNIDAAYKFLDNEKVAIAIDTTNYRGISYIRNQVIAWNSAHPNDLVMVPVNQNYQTIQYSWVPSNITEFITYNNLFGQGTIPIVPNAGNREIKSFFDAMLIKAYNGISRGQYLSISFSSGTNKPILSISDTNNRNENYVRRVSNHSD